MPQGHYPRRYLAPRRKRALELFAAGMSMREIGITMGISPATVKRHLLEVRCIFGVEKTRAAVKIARERGFIE